MSKKLFSLSLACLFWLAAAELDYEQVPFPDPVKCPVTCEISFKVPKVMAFRTDWECPQVKCDLKAWMDAGVPCKDCSVDGHDAFATNGNGPLLVRLGWHCSGTYNKTDGTGGCDGARVRFKPEFTDPENAGLQEAMLQLEEEFLKKYGPYEGLTYADLYTLAGSVAVENMGGMVVPWRPGRVDATDGSDSPQHGRLPQASGDASHVRDVFTRLGFNESQTVALIGAHTLGCAHIGNSGYDGCWMPTPKHRQFNNEFFNHLLGKPWIKETVPESGSGTAARLLMLPADMALLEDKKYKVHVEEFAKENERFKRAFSDAYHKLLELGTDLDGKLYDKPLDEICEGRISKSTKKDKNGAVGKSTKKDKNGAVGRFGTETVIFNVLFSFVFLMRLIA